MAATIRLSRFSAMVGRLVERPERRYSAAFALASAFRTGSFQSGLMKWQV